METKQYDVVVIGAGSGGLTAAVGFCKVGKRVLLVERDEHLGGECTNSGCIPSKALLHHAKEYYRATQIVGQCAAGVPVFNEQRDSKNQYPWGETFRREAFSYVRSKIAEILAGESPETFATLGIDVVKGEAVFNDKCSIKVGETVYRYKHAVIATGSSPRLLDIPGLNQADVLTNQNIFDLTDVPQHTLIIGAGPIGMEMGQALAMLGSHVTIATIDEEFARLEDEAIRPIVRQQFEKLGVRIELAAHVVAEENSFAIFRRHSPENTAEEFRIPYDKVLIAIGRVPNLPAGLEQAGIAYDERCIMVDSQHRTSNKYVYAVGDVAQRLKFTHTADDTARQVVTRVASRGLLRVNKRKAVPKVTYTLPELAQVGLSWSEALEKYAVEELMRIEVPFSENDRARTDSETDGLLVVIARRVNGAVLGAHIIGPSAGELLAVFTLAIDKKISLWALRRLIYAYPTYSLVIKKAGDQFFARQVIDLKQDLAYIARKHAPKIIAGIFWIIFLAALYRYQANNDMSVLGTTISLFEFIALSAWGPLLYIVAYTVRPLTFFPGTALTILSGLFFGFWLGTLYTIIAANLSASVAYAVGRFFGQDLKLEDTAVGQWVQGLQTAPFVTTLVMRMIFLPFDIVSYIAGILKLPFLPYLSANFVGTLLGIATFVSIGASLQLDDVIANGLTIDAIDYRFVILSIVIFAVSIGLSKVLKRWRAVTD